MRANFNPLSPFELRELPPQLDERSIHGKEFVSQLVASHRALADLNGTCRAINPLILLNIPLLQESAASSEIEGIHTTVESMLENQVKESDERDPASKEALRYRDAIQAGLRSLKQYALSSRTILAIHQELLEGGGAFRTQQSQIAKGRSVIYTPPPSPQLPRLMGNWESFLHQDSTFDALVQTALCHYQFEAIHPFSDGNGRAGRILMVLQMVQKDLLDLPVLYVSGYLVKHRNQYYDALLEVTRSGDWLGFVMFMLKAFEEQAKKTRAIVQDIVRARSDLKRRIRRELPSIYSADLVEHIFSYPVTFPTFMADRLNITYQTASKHLSALKAADILDSRKSGRHTLYYNRPLFSCLRT